MIPASHVPWEQVAKTTTRKVGRNYPYHEVLEETRTSVLRVPSGYPEEAPTLVILGGRQPSHHARRREVGSGVLRTARWEGWKESCRTARGLYTSDTAVATPKQDGCTARTQLHIRIAERPVQRLIQTLIKQSGITHWATPSENWSSFQP